MLLILSGKRLCARCRNKIYSEKSKVEDELELERDPLFEPAKEKKSLKELSILGINPAKIRKLNCNKREKMIQNAVIESSKSIIEELNSLLNCQVANPASEDLLWAETYKSLIEELKSKFEKYDEPKERIKILSLTPKFWTKEKVCEEFDARKHEVEETRDLLRKKEFYQN